MKSLQKISGSRSEDVAVVQMHIGNCLYTYRQQRDRFQNIQLSHEERQDAYQKMVKAFELLQNWREVREDILKRRPSDKKQREGALHC
jgi:hypothetical protein